MPNISDIRSPDQRCFDGQRAGFYSCKPKQRVTRLAIMTRVALNLSPHDPRHAILRQLLDNTKGTSNDQA